jgi:ElaB/YqjD/DUF883 family membrane-anchored ribosome-binding protein
MMMTSHPSSTEQKRDLHVGGVGTRTGGALAAITHPIDQHEAINDWAWRAKATLHDAEDAVRDNPWAAIAAVAVVGLGLGYLLGRRS